MKEETKKVLKQIFVLFIGIAPITIVVVIAWCIA